MIRNFGTRALKRLYEHGDRSGINPPHLGRVQRILAHLDIATNSQDMNIPGWRLHRLRGDLRGFWSVDISGNWRIIFRFEDGEPCDVRYLDTHYKEARKMPMKNPPHPGLTIRHDCIEALGLSVTKAAEVLGVTRQALTNILTGRSAISPEMAVRLEKAFGSTAQAWLRLQGNYDLSQIDRDEIEVTAPLALAE